MIGIDAAIVAVVVALPPVSDADEAATTVESLVHGGAPLGSLSSNDDGRRRLRGFCAARCSSCGVFTAIISCNSFRIS